MRGRLLRAHSFIRACKARPDLMKKFLRDLWTADAESKVWDWLRFHGSIVVAAGLVGFIVGVAKGSTMDWLLPFGTGFGGLLAGIAGGMALRKDREKE